MDIIQAVKEIDTEIETIQKIRDDIETYHDQWFTEIEKMCDITDTVPSIPRMCSHQTQRSNTPANSPSQYFICTVSIPLIDHLLSELNSRFCKHQSTLLLGLCIVPSAMLVMPASKFLTNSSQLAEKYNDNLPSPSSFASELECWKVRWQKHGEQHGAASLPDNPTAALQQISSMYPNITVLKILSILPITTCSAERSFSSLKRTKTPFRSSMTTERMTG